MSEKIIGIIANRDFFFRKCENSYIENFYYSVPSAVYENTKNNPCVIIPYNVKFIDFYSNLIDGLILIGSDTNICPSFYKQEKKYDFKSCQEKNNFEISFIKNFYNKNKPIFGICAGMQNINVAFGGTLHQNIKEDLKLNHIQSNALDKTSHEIILNKNSKLFNILKEEKINVNSFHNQGVKDLAENFIASSKDSNGLIESIEMKNHKFCIGVQWHPESNANKKDYLIFESFIENL